jgi:hypothetical protein
MYAHAPTYPSLRARSSRRSRGARPVRVHRPAFFLRGATQHLRSVRASRVVARRRVPRASWSREVFRVTAAIANVAAWTVLFALAL